LVRFAALGQLSPDTAILGEASLLARFSTMGAVYFMDLQLLIAPTLLEVDFYYQVLIGILERPGPASVLGWAGMGLLGVGALRVSWQLSSPTADTPTRSHDARAAALLALAIFFVFLFPTSHFIGFGALMAERFLFAPSLGFVLLIVIVTRAALDKLGSRRLATTLATGLVLVTAIPAAMQSRARADEWRDEVRLWSTAARHITGDIRVHTNLAAAHFDRGQIDAARQQLDRALEIDPNYREALGNLANVELEDGNIAGAILHYRRMLEIEPGDFLTWNNLGIAEYRRGRYPEAVQHFERALEINPNFAFSRSNLDAAHAALAGQSAPQRSK
jgi:tetratricopeptide (TPR) repeat protein